MRLVSVTNLKGLTRTGVMDMERGLGVWNMFSKGGNKAGSSEATGGRVSD
ncbi:MAG TPA: hypothetical protein VGM63_07045 [Mucilaginibacter sp.]